MFQSGTFSNLSKSAGIVAMSMADDIFPENNELNWFGLH